MKNSFRGWESRRFIAGRDRLAVAMLGGAIGAYLSQDILVAVLSAVVAESLYSLYKYYRCK